MEKDKVIKEVIPYINKDQGRIDQITNEVKKLQDLESLPMQEQKRIIDDAKKEILKITKLVLED